MSVLALLAATALSSPAEQSPHDAVRVTALEGGRIGLQQGNVRSTLNVAASINGCTGQVYDGWSGDKYGLGFGLRVIDQVKKGNHWYLVLQTDSNPNCNIQGMCGAASNTDLIWLKLDLRLQPLARQTEVLEDCYTNTVLTSVSGQKGNLDRSTSLEMRQGVFTATTETDAGKTVQLRYERARPELGLQRR